MIEHRVTAYFSGRFAKPSFLMSRNLKKQGKFSKRLMFFVALNFRTLHYSRVEWSNLGHMHYCTQLPTGAYCI